MAPTLAPGDILILRNRPPQPGEIAVLEHPRFGRIVKRVDVEGQLSGDNPDSTSSERLGLITDAQLIGTAVLALTPRGFKRLRPRRPYSPRA